MTRSSLVRYSAAALVITASFWLAGVAGSLVGWSFEPQGWHRVTDGLATLVVSWAVATGGIAAGRAVLGRSGFSWWLVLGVVPPLYFALAEGAGVV